MSKITIGQFAVTMQHSTDHLVARMKQDGILQTSGPPIKKFINQGYFEVLAVVERRVAALPMSEFLNRISNVPDPIQSGKERLVAMLTGKGQIWLARKYPADCELGSVN